MIGGAYKSMNLRGTRKRSAILALSVSTMFIAGATVFQAPSAWASSATQPPIVSGKVVISTSSELWYVDQNQTAMIASGSSTNYLEASIELAPDTTFDLTGTSWMPFGETTAEPFKGVFDGNNDVISGVSIVPGEDTGFFGVADNASLENINLKGDSIVLSSGYTEGNVGGLVGLLEGSTVKNISVTDVKLSAPSTKKGSYGGAIGSAITSTIADTDVTGIVAASSGYDGGLVGFATNPTVSGSRADVVVSGGLNNGGLIGQVYHGSIDDSVASGDVTGQSMADGWVQNGGLVGYGAYFTMDDSVALGSVSGDHIASGSVVANGGLIAGAHIAHISGSYAAGSITGDNLSGGKSNDVMNGGFMGYLASGTVNNAFSLGNVTGGPDTTDGGIAGELDSSGRVYDAYTVGAVVGGTGSKIGGLVGGIRPTALLDDVVYAAEPSINALGSGSSSAVESGSVMSASMAAMETALGSGVLSWLSPTVWSEASTLNRGLPYITADGAPTGGGTASTGGSTPPVIVTEPITIDGLTTSVITSMGYNTSLAITVGTYLGFILERDAVEAGLSLSGEGGHSIYVEDILSGSGPNASMVSPAQQAEFAAMYQKLSIIPSLTDTLDTVAQGVGALQNAGATELAIENYLVELYGWSWGTAKAQAQAGFPVLNS